MSSTNVIAAPKESENTLVQEIPLDRIQASAANPRESMDHQALSELTDSIKTRGVLQPILVRPLAEGKYEIVCGERRLRASSCSPFQRDMDLPMKRFSAASEVQRKCRG